MSSSSTERILKFGTEKASNVYDRLTFNDSSDLFNQTAPSPLATFLIGGVFCLASWVYFFLRVRAIKQQIEATSNNSTNNTAVFGGKIMLRALISSYIDANDPGYVIVKMAAQSFIFLAGFQLNYQLAFIVMLGVFAFESSLDSLRILLALSEVNSLRDLVVTGANLRTKLRKPSTELKPKSVYEDTTRSSSIVAMVFITQAMLICFVVVDIFDSDRHSCLDGTGNCPVGGTLGSWMFYVLGIFMQCVFLLGPKTAFGQSEQNPAYWLQLLLASKQSGAQITWYDPVKDENRFRDLKPSDLRIWLRFFMSFLINGVGFHILVHALPVQVASQGSLTGVVFRAVGMLYLVDLDDTPGYTVTIVEGAGSQAVQAPSAATGAAGAEIIKHTATKDDECSTPSQSSADLQQVLSEAQISDEASKIIAEARAKLDLLATGKSAINSGGNGMVGGGSMIGMLGITGAIGGGAVAAAAVAAGGEEEAEEGDGAVDMDEEAGGVEEESGDIGGGENV